MVLRAISAAHYHASLSTSTIKTACAALIRGIDHLKSIYDEVASNPRVDTFLDELGIRDSVAFLGSHERNLLLKQIEDCVGDTHVAVGPQWDKWVREIAAICPALGITPSGEGPDRSITNSSSKFVLLMRRLQAELPDICAEHEKDAAFADASFARAVRSDVPKTLCGLRLATPRHQHAHSARNVG